MYGGSITGPGSPASVATPNPFLMTSPFSSAGGLAFSSGYGLPGASRSTTSAGTVSSSAWLGRYMRRALAWSSLDWPLAGAQIAFALRSPAKLGQLTRLRKNTRGTWCRDDPAVVLALLGLYFWAAVAYGVAYRMWSPVSLLLLAVNVCAQFLAGSAAVAVGCWWLANRHLKHTHALPHSVEQHLEGMYAFDVAMNAAVAVLLYCAVLPLLAAPLVLSDGFLGVLTGNALLALAAGHYWYVTFTGYSILPFLQSSKLNVFLIPAAVTIALLVVATVLQLNCASLLLGMYV